MMAAPLPETVTIGAFEYLRPPRPIFFPSEEKVPEGRRHLRLRTFLWQLLEAATKDRAVAGSDQFIYWDASNPKRCLAPDVYVRVAPLRTDDWTSWKTWERGAPQLAVEILSDNDKREENWNDKLARYHALGVDELVRFDADAPAGTRIRIWDRVGDDLVERRIRGDRALSPTLGLHWVVAPCGEDAVGLRVARDAEGRDLVLSPLESTESRLDDANARIRELEAELRRRDGG